MMDTWYGLLWVRTLPSKFNSIKLSYNAQKEQWIVEEMTTILAKEEEDMKTGRNQSISMVSNLDNANLKRKISPKNTNDHKPFKEKNIGANKVNAPNVASTPMLLRMRASKKNEITTRGLGIRSLIARSLSLF